MTAPDPMELKACPLCDRRPKINRMKVRCLNSECGLFYVLVPIDKWNRRASPSDAVAALERLTKAVLNHALHDQISTAIEVDAALAEASAFLRSTTPAVQETKS